MSYYVKTFPVGIFECNCSILVKQDSKKCMIVDPGDEAHTLLEIVKTEKLEVVALWHTHAHLDHIGATKILFETLSKEQIDKGQKAPIIYLHPEDKWLYENVAIQSHFLGLPTFAVSPQWEKITSKQSYQELPQLEALHTPGHTPGSCCLHIKSHTEIDCQNSMGAGLDRSVHQALISGDTLFRRSIGRTDLWGGNFPQIINSIEKKLFSLDPKTLVIPGHGPLTSIEEEIEKNPFIK